MELKQSICFNALHAKQVQSVILYINVIVNIGIKHGREMQGNQMDGSGREHCKHKSITSFIIVIHILS